MTEFENYIIPIANDKLNYLLDTYGIFVNTEWIMCVLVAAADLKRQGLEYKDQKQTLDHAFDIWFNETKRNSLIGDSDRFLLVDRDKLKKSDEHYFVKEYLFRLPDIYYRDFIKACVAYDRIFAIPSNVSAYYAAGLLIEVSKIEISELVRLNYTDMSGCTDLR